MEKFLPFEIYKELERHIIDNCKKAQLGYSSAEDDEDTLTGDLFARLQIKEWSGININSFLDSWKWKIDYKKFRGRGPDALEKYLGADGIFQIEVHDENTTFKKAILFQAKKGAYRKNKDLKEQLSKIEKFNQSSSAVFVYSPNGYVAVTGNEYLGENYKEHKLCKYLSSLFLNCHVGVKNLFYDFEERHIYRPDGKSFDIKQIGEFKNILNINIKKPRY